MLEQHLVAGAYLPQIFQFAAMAVKSKEKQTEDQSMILSRIMKGIKRITTVTIKTLKTAQELQGLNPYIMPVRQFEEALR